MTDSRTPRTDDKRNCALILGWNKECIWEWAEELEQETERLTAALEYWLPKHEPLASQVDSPSLVHKSQWHSAHALLAARKEKV